MIVISTQPLASTSSNEIQMWLFAPECLFEIMMKRAQATMVSCRSEQAPIQHWSSSIAKKFT